MVDWYLTNTHFPVQVPSTSVNNFCFTVCSRLGPKYRGCKRISCSRDICGYIEREHFRNGGVDTTKTQLKPVLSLSYACVVCVEIQPLVS